DFSILSGSFKIAKGIVSNSDLKLNGPLVRLSGEGRVDLPRQYLNYKARPKLVASLEGQGGKENLKGLTIPVKIKGPWSKPKIIPDLKSLLKDPDSLVKGAKSIAKTAKGIGKKLKHLKKRDAKALIEGLIRNGGKAESDDPVGGLLKNLLSR
ncbi:MAG TPA: AsmA family protein, partial [Rhizobiales bacterium]|nr:AsmA family protein [Hyphomicrobiales bacterium]